MTRSVIPRRPRFARPRNDIVAIVLALLAASPAFAEPREPAPPAKIEVTARPIGAFEPRDPQRVRFGPLTFRGGLSLTSPHRGVRRHLGAPRAGRRRKLHRGQRQGALDPRPHRLRRHCVRPASRTPRSRRCSDPTAARCRRAAGTTRNRSRRTAARSGSASSGSIASCASISAGTACSARGQPIAVPPGIQRLPQQQGARMPRGRAAHAAARRHADRDLGARPRCRRQHPGLPDRRPEPGRIFGQAHRRRSTSAIARSRRPATCCCWSAAIRG